MKFSILVALQAFAMVMAGYYAGKAFGFDVGFALWFSLMALTWNDQR